MNAIDSMPNFMIIGAAKGGTTSLYELLKEHPQVAFSRKVKEPGFFSNDAQHERGLDWYVETYYPHAASFPLRGDASTAYLYWSEKTAGRILQAYGEQPPKIVVSFRNPVQRAYSYYWHDYRYGKEKRPFAQAIVEEERCLRDERARLDREGSQDYGYFRGGCYAALLQPFLDAFPREQFLFLLTDDLKADFAGVSTRLHRFLGLEQPASPEIITSNSAQRPRSMRLVYFLNEPSKYKGVFKTLLPESLRMWVKQKIRKANLRTFEYPPMDPALERELRERFRDEVTRLEEMIGRDLSSWMAE